MKRAEAEDACALRSRIGRRYIVVKQKHSFFTPVSLKQLLKVVEDGLKQGFGGVLGWSSLPRPRGASIFGSVSYLSSGCPPSCARRETRERDTAVNSETLMCKLRASSVEKK